LTDKKTSAKLSMPANPLPTKIGIVLFPGFQLLDAAGPLDAFHLLSQQTTLNLSILAANIEPVPTQTWAQDKQGSKFSPSIVPTHAFADAPTDLVSKVGWRPWKRELTIRRRK
jgi:hypothetical protein